MRTDILKLVEALPGSTQTQVSAFFAADTAPYIDALVRDGLLKDEVRKTGLPGRPARRLRLTKPPRDTIEVSDRLAGEHARAKLQAARWMMSLTDDPITQEVLAELMSAPSYWAGERRLADLMSRCGVDEGGKGWMQPAKKLASMGVIELRVRKGIGKETTCWLLDPPPYPLA